MDATAQETRWRSWTPRVPLTAAEHRVDFPGINDHIVQRRLAVERYALPAARRLAFLVAEHGLPTSQVERDLEGRLYVSLARSVTFGYEQVRRELRGDRPTIQASLRIPGIGTRGRVALSGLQGVHGLVRTRASLVARDVAEAATLAAHQAAKKPAATKVAVTLAVGDSVQRTLHNDVLQIVSEALNLGRAAGAMSVPKPPEYAMRSEQLDENTCDSCDELHGMIVQVGSAEFFDLEPPAECEGGGRCRGIYVYGD
jgi:hypothetical protein